MSKIDKKSMAMLDNMFKTFNSNDTNPEEIDYFQNLAASSKIDDRNPNKEVMDRMGSILKAFCPESTAEEIDQQMFDTEAKGRHNPFPDFVEVEFTDGTKQIVVGDESDRPAPPRGSFKNLVDKENK